MVDYQSMGKRVRKYREAKGWNQSDLAFAVHMSNTTISHIEVGTGRPELNTVVKIANALGVTVDMLLCESYDAASVVYNHELSECLNSCSAEELRLIRDVITPLLESFRRSVRTRRKDKYGIDD